MLRRFQKRRKFFYERIKGGVVGVLGSHHHSIKVSKVGAVLKGGLDSATNSVAAGLVSDLFAGGEPPISGSREGSQGQTLPSGAMPLLEDALKLAAT